jgi:hypothetical protein
MIITVPSSLAVVPSLVITPSSPAGLAALRAHPEPSRT